MASMPSRISMDMAAYTQEKSQKISLDEKDGEDEKILHCPFPLYLLDSGKFFSQAFRYGVREIGMAGANLQPEVRSL